MFDEFILEFDTMQELVFKGKFSDADKKFADDMHLWEKLISLLPEVALAEFNDIFMQIFVAKKAQDYLLLTDILEFRLKPFLDKIKSKVGGDR